MTWTKQISENLTITNENLRISYYLSDVDQSLWCTLEVQAEANGVSYSKAFSCAVQDAIDNGSLTTTQRTAIINGSLAIRNYLLAENDYTES